MVEYFDREVEKEELKPISLMRIHWLFSVFTYFLLSTTALFFLLKAAQQCSEDGLFGGLCYIGVILFSLPVLFFILVFWVTVLVTWIKKHKQPEELNRRIFYLGRRLVLLQVFLYGSLIGFFFLTNRHWSSPEHQTVYKRGEKQVRFNYFTEGPVFNAAGDKVDGLQVELGFVPNKTGSYIVIPPYITDLSEAKVMEGSGPDGPPAERKTVILKEGEEFRQLYYMDIAGFLAEKSEYRQYIQEKHEEDFNWYVLWMVDFEPSWPQSVWRKAKSGNIFVTRKYHQSQY